MSACNPLKLPVIPKNHTRPSNNIIQLVCIPPKIRDVIILSLKRSKCIFILTNLLQEQEQLLDATFNNHESSEGWLILSIPAAGLTAEQQMVLADSLKGFDVVFASPLPLLIRELAGRDRERVFIFHNSRREKKELPGGKIIYTVPKEGWELL